MSLDELGEALEELEDARKTAEAEIAALRSTQGLIEELESDREALLEDLSGQVPEALDALTGEERARVYRMLRLEVEVTPDGDYRLPGMFCSCEPSSAVAST